MKQALEPVPTSLSKAEFIERFAHLYEHSPWVASMAFDSGLSNTQNHPEGLHTLMSQTLLAASKTKQLALINAHPDLAGQAAMASNLTPASTTEQASAGLDQCTPDELNRFQLLNTRYQAKFGFPFILAVKGLNRIDILANFEQRLNNSAETEFATALEQINKIAWLRLQSL